MEVGEGSSVFEATRRAFYVHDKRLSGWAFPYMACDRVVSRRGDAVSSTITMG